ncbi:hypothetical protein GCM10023149_45870 [Mucilaginibacter gynuensis]|uniref:Lipoprotein n=1 Tax=Mucilaginibacter gynuensis TaxID=1302236 RepID=A0ABP8HAS5_9SPHI
MIHLKKHSLNLILFLIPCVLYSGCALFTESKEKLAKYCPGLKVDLNNVNIKSNANNNESRVSYILGYNADNEQEVEDYFMNGNHGYTTLRDNAFFIREDKEKEALSDVDIAVGKTIDHHKTHTIVVFNKSKSRIIIIETTKG